MVEIIDDYYCTNVYGELTNAQREHNAAKIYYFFKLNYNWLTDAIAAVVGNMEAESGLSPTQVQGGAQVITPSTGLGLVQWTPSTKLTNWASGEGLDWRSGNTQLKRMIVEYLAPSGTPDHEWYAAQSGGYDYRGCYYYSTFAHRENDDFDEPMDVNYKAGAFVINYLRPASPSVPTRQAHARRWESFFNTLPPRPYLPAWLLKKLHDNNIRRY